MVERLMRHSSGKKTALINRTHSPTSAGERRSVSRAETPCASLLQDPVQIPGKYLNRHAAKVQTPKDCNLRSLGHFASQHTKEKSEKVYLQM